MSPIAAPTRWRGVVDAAARAVPRGRVERVVGLHIEVAGVDAAIGDLVRVEVGTGPAANEVACEVVALHGEQLVCMPFGELHGVRVGAAVAPTGAPHRIAVGHGSSGASSTASAGRSTAGRCRPG